VITMSRTIQVTYDCADPEGLSRFWAAVLGYVNPGPPGRDVPAGQDVFDPGGAGPRLFFQKVPEGKIVKNRVHLDVRAAPGLQGDERMAALEAECERLVGLGGTRLQRYEPDPPLQSGHIVMQDPEGNEFCLD
jgi:Glyoxalase-like domain